MPVKFARRYPPSARPWSVLAGFGASRPQVFSSGSWRATTTTGRGPRTTGLHPHRIRLRRLVRPRRPETTLSFRVDTSEAMPPVGSGLSLSRSNIRYCSYQGIRLEAARSMITTESQRQGFNTASTTTTRAAASIDIGRATRMPWMPSCPESDTPSKPRVARSPQHGGRIHYQGPGSTDDRRIDKNAVSTTSAKRPRKRRT